MDTAKRINILIPMAGRGKRFLEGGYAVPKPLLPVDGKTMVEHVIHNLSVPGAHFIFLVLDEHVKSHQLDARLKKLVPGCEVIIVDQVTQGAACTALLAQSLIDNDTPLIIKDCDQILDWVPSDFFAFMARNHGDGGIVTIHTKDRGFSFIEPMQKGGDYFYVNRTAEKVAISDIGASGLYYFRAGRIFVQYAKSMIAKNIRTNDEFYVCPVYNELIDGGLTVLYYPIPQMLSLGTPADFERNRGRVGELLYGSKS